MGHIFSLEAWVKPEVIVELFVALFTCLLALATFGLALGTWKAIKEAEKERRERLMPLLVPRGDLEWDENFETFQMEVRNVGPGPSLNVYGIVHHVGASGSFNRSVFGPGQSEKLKPDYRKKPGDWASQMQLDISYEDCFGAKFTTECVKEGIGRTTPGGLAWRVRYIGRTKPKPPAGPIGL